MGTPLYAVRPGPRKRRALLKRRIDRLRENLIDLNVVVDDLRRELARAEHARDRAAATLARLVDRQRDGAAAS